MTRATYPEYRSHKRTTFDELPSHWEVVRGRHLVSIRTGSGDTVDAEPDGEFPFFVRSDNALRSDRWEFDTTAVLTAGDGAGVAKVFHLVSGKFMAHQRVYVLAGFKRVTPQFFFYAFSSMFHLIALDGSAKSTVDSVRRPMIADMPFGVPPVDEQHAITNFLDRETTRVDALIAEQKGLIDVLRERRVALISRMVTRGLDRDVELADSGADWLGEVPQHWGVKRLKFSIKSTQTGVWGQDPTGDSDDVLCVRVADFDRPKLRVADTIPTVRSVRESDRLPRLLQPGDLLLEKSGGTAINPVGFVGIFDGAAGPAVSSNFLTRLRPAEGQNPRYWLYAHAASYATRLTARSVNQTTGIQNLDQAAYFDELFPFPPLKEQTAIADYLDEKTGKIDALIAEAEGIVTVARERRSALITAAVTGQIDVRGEVA